MRGLRHMFKVFGEVVGKSPALRTALIACAAAVALLTVGYLGVSALAAGSRAQQPAAEEPQPEPEPEERPSVLEGKTGRDAELAEALVSYVWSSTGRTVLFREDGTASVRDGDEEPREATWNLRDAETRSEESVFEDNAAPKTIVTNTTTFLLEWDGEATTATFSATASSDGTTILLESAPTGELTGSAPSNEVTIADEPAGLDEALLGHGEALEAALREWCPQHSPAALVATWSGEATRDWVTGLVSVTLTLDDMDGTVVTAILDTATETFELKSR